MLTSINFLNFLIPCLYIGLLIIYTIDFVSDSRNYIIPKRYGLISVIVFHFIYIILRSVEFNHAPITNGSELFTLIAFTIIVSYYLLELFTKTRTTGFIIIFISLVFQLSSSFFIQNVYEVKEVLRNPLLGVHVVSALLGDSSLTISACYGILFVILYKRIKNRNYGKFFNKLPNLEILEKMSFMALLIGYVVLSISILIGAIWLPIAFPDFKHYDPKLLSTIFIWLVYTAGITVKIFLKWYGRKVIFVSLIGFIVLIISMIIPVIFSSSFHNFQK